MSRRTQQKRARHMAAQEADLRQQMEQIEADGIKIGMSWDEALQLICDAARELRHEFTVSGLATKAPWGLALDPRSLEASISAGIRLFRKATDEISTDRELSEDASTEIYFKLISGAMTLGGAALLYLQSQPLSYVLARYVIAKDEDTSR